MKIAYLAGPYRSDSVNGLYENIQRARRIALEYWRLGYAVICPHLNTAFMDGACPDNVWLEGDIEIMLRCDVVVMLPGGKESKGAWEEYTRAVADHKQIIYEPEE